MLFECVLEISEKELDASNYKKITPIYKSLHNDLTDEIAWIHEKLSCFDEIICELAWDMYYDDFIEKKILSKHNFYKLVRRELSLKNKAIRISQDEVKYCFVKK